MLPWRCGNAEVDTRAARFVNTVSIFISQGNRPVVRAEREPRGVDASGIASGFVVFRASRMDALLDPFTKMLDATRPESVLAPQTIIAAHPGLRQWLSGALAQRRGTRGIAANLDVLLPSAWIDAQAREQLGRRAVSLPSYGQKRLRWTIHAILTDDPQRYGINVARLGTFLRGEPGLVERRRFQLADRLARIYSQYLVYRPDWLAQWEKSRFVTTKQGADAIEPELLAPLWREARRRLGAHRGEIVEELVEALRKDALFTDRSAVHVFGVSHLAPSELRVLRAAAATRVVALYVPDPCREYWGGISADPQLPARRACRRRRSASSTPVATISGWNAPIHCSRAGGVSASTSCWRSPISVRTRTFVTGRMKFRRRRCRASIACSRASVPPTAARSKSICATRSRASASSTTVRCASTRATRACASSRSCATTCSTRSIRRQVAAKRSSRRRSS